MPMPLARGVWESHWFWTTSRGTLLPTAVTGSAGLSQNAHGVMLEAKSPYSGYLALSRIASRRYCSGSRGQAAVSPQTTDQKAALPLSAGGCAAEEAAVEADQRGAGSEPPGRRPLRPGRGRRRPS